jgi:hypothetical protein
MKTLPQIENKIKELYGQRKPEYTPKGGFILSNGMLFATTNHAAFCKSVDCTLTQAIKLGVCRFFSRTGIGGNVAAFEYRKTRITTQQKTMIRKILRSANFYTVVTEKETVERFRPIRTIKF